MTKDVIKDMTKDKTGKDAETIICRCEDISREEIRSCIAAGYKTPDEIKRVTRAGMGPCQGRTCRNLIAVEISRACGIPVEEVQTAAFRPPVKPIGLDMLADAFTESTDGEHK